MREEIQKLGEFSVYVHSDTKEFKKLDDFLDNILSKSPARYTGTGTMYGIKYEEENNYPEYKVGKLRPMCRSYAWGKYFNSVDDFIKEVQPLLIENLEIF